MMRAMTWLAFATAATVCLAPSVHDGDTIRCGEERIRILNIDAPEMAGSPKCTRVRSGAEWCDYEAAVRSRDALRAFLARGRPLVERAGTDRYGRTLARVSVGGRDAGEYLVSIGLARPWR